MLVKHLLNISEQAETIRIQDTHRNDLYSGSICNIPKELQDQHVIVYSCRPGDWVSCMVAFIDTQIRGLTL